MNIFLKRLISAGLSEHEAKVYYALLKFGDGTATDLAKKTNIGRTNIYDYADSLILMGLVSKHEKSRKTVFSAEDPNQLKEIVNGRLRDAKTSSANLAEIMGDLDDLYTHSVSKPIVKTYSGRQGYKSVLDEIYLKTTTNDIYLFINDLDRFETPEPKYRNQFLREGKFMHLYVNKGELLKEFQHRDEKESRKTILLEISKLKISEDIIITGDTLVIGSINKNSFSVNIIKHSPLASFLKQLVNNL